MPSSYTYNVFLSSLIMCMYVYMGYVHTSTGAYRGQWYQILSGARVTGVVSCLTWLLGIKLRSSWRQVFTLRPLF